MNERDELFIPIEGMTCAACVKKVENVLSKVQDVERVSVNLITEKVSLKVRRISPELLRKIIKAIEDAGYGVSTQKVVIPVYGLSMLPTGSVVEERLKKLAGVTSVILDPLEEKVTVTFVPTVVSIEDIKSVLGRLGLKVPEVLENEIEYYEYEEIKRQEEERSLRRRFIVSASLSGIILFDMVFHFFFHLENRHSVNLILFLLATPVFFYGGGGFLKAFFRSSLRLSFDMNALISVGSGSAYVLSTINTFTPYFSGHFQLQDVYFETSSVIITLVLLGRLLESKAKKRAYEALKKLSSFIPKKATVIRNGRDFEVSIKEIKEGDILLVRPGERVAADGTIVQGYGILDESSITGEALPKERRSGDSVFASTLNQAGSFTLKVTKIGKDMLLSQIINIVKESQASKQPVQVLADRVASVFVPIIFLVATGAFLFWLFSGYTLSFSLMIFVSVLIVACPCALGLATPIAVFVASSKAAENGMLIKNGEAFEIAKRLNYVILDKTGTLTYGIPEVKAILAISPTKESELLVYSASLERNSEHPLGKAIVRYATEKGLNLLEPESFQYHPGQGILGEIGSKNIQVGSLSFMERLGIKGVEKHRHIYEGFLSEGNTVIVVAIDGHVSGFIAIGDTVRKEAKDVIYQLGKMKIRVGLLTGDNPTVAQAISKKVGIYEVFAGLLPHEKSKKIEELKKAGYLVAMVGDGINDAPALSAAHVGFAMGGGTDIAAQTADVILIKDDLGGIIKFVRLSSITYRITRENLFWAFLYNLVLVPVAAGFFYPYFGILLKPVYASLAMTISSLFVVTNSLRIKKKGLGDEK